MDRNVIACFCVCVCVCMCVQMRVLRWRMESRKLMGCKSLVRHIPQFPLPSAKAAWSSSFISHGLLVLSCRSTLFTSFLLFTSVRFYVCVCVSVYTLSIISGLSEQDVSCFHCSPTSFQCPLKYKSALSFFFLLFNLSSSTEENKA